MEGYNQKDSLATAHPGRCYEPRYQINNLLSELQLLNQPTCISIEIGIRVSEYILHVHPVLTCVSHDATTVNNSMSQHQLTLDTTTYNN